MPNWAEQVTAIATAVSALGLLSAIGAVIFAGQQAREARINRQAEMAAEFFRRWSESPMVETRRFVAQFDAAAGTVMERLDGRDMLADLGSRLAGTAGIARTLAGLHNRLHAIAATAGVRPGVDRPRPVKAIRAPYRG